MTKSFRSFPGLRNKPARERFFEELAKAQKRLRALRIGNFSGSANPFVGDFNPLRCLKELNTSGQRDEAVWLAFLVTHLGPRRGQDKWNSIKNFYGKFDSGLWDWQLVKQNPEEVREWMIGLKAKIKELKFGNHRKYETNNPVSPKGTASVIQSFCKWTGFSPVRVIEKLLVADPEESFQRVFDNIRIVRFGRTAKFDFLSLLGNLKIFPIKPGHCYLKDATGPRTGAILLCTGRRNGTISKEIEERVRKLQAVLPYDAEALEDALCNWQKKNMGFLSSVC